MLKKKKVILAIGIVLLLVATAALTYAITINLTKSKNNQSANIDRINSEEQSEKGENISTNKINQKNAVKEVIPQKLQGTWITEQNENNGKSGDVSILSLKADGETKMTTLAIQELPIANRTSYNKLYIPTVNKVNGKTVYNSFDGKIAELKDLGNNFYECTPFVRVMPGQIGGSSDDPNFEIRVYMKYIERDNMPPMLVPFPVSTSKGKHVDVEKEWQKIKDFVNMDSNTGSKIPYYFKFS